MSRYYFDLEFDDRVLTDVQGAELPDADAARSAGEDAACELIASRLHRGEGVGDEVLHLRDERGICILRLPYAAFTRARSH